MTENDERVANRLMLIDARTALQQQLNFTNAVLAGNHSAEFVLIHAQTTESLAKAWALIYDRVRAGQDYFEDV